VPTNLPYSIDAFTNPTSSDSLNTAGVLHDQQHANVNDAVEQLEVWWWANRKIYNVERPPYAAIPAQYFSDGVANATTTFTSASANFTGMAGWHISILHAGASIDQSWTTTIVSVTNANTVVLANATGRSATGCPFFVGQSQQAAIQAACDDAWLAGGGLVLIPGAYFVDGLMLGNRVKLRGLGIRASWLILTVNRDNAVITTRVSPECVQSVTITAGGSGYSASPFAVSFTGGGGTTAAGIAYTSGGAIIRVVMTDSGKNYTSAPTPVFTVGGGTGAAGTAIMGAGEAQFIDLSHFAIEGSRQRQQGASGVAHGIFFNTLNQGDGRNDDMETADGNWKVTEVEFYNTLNSGIYSNQKGNSTFVACKAFYCMGYGFRAGYDSTLVGCLAGQSGLAGFYVSAACDVSGCRAYYSGGITASLGYGFHIENVNFSTVNLDGCSAQDNKAAAILIKNCKSVTINGFTADSNGTRGTYAAPTDPALIIDGCLYCRVSGLIAIEREISGQGTGTQRYGLKMLNACDGNVIEMTHRGLNAAGGGFTYDTALAPLDPSSDAAAVIGNTIIFNGQEGTQQATFAASFIPDPYNGGTIELVLTANITINDVFSGTVNAQTFYRKHYGLVMTFAFQQDATGGRTITWNALYATTWQPESAPSARSVIQVYWDNTNWRVLSTSNVAKAVNVARWHETITFTNMTAPGGSAIAANTWGVIFVGANGQRQVVNPTGYVQYRVLLHYNQPVTGAGTLQFRVIDQVTQTNVLHSFAGDASTGELEKDSGWQTMPAWLTSGVDRFIIPQIQANNTTADPVFRSLAVYFR
jgi:hypothetical protein